MDYVTDLLENFEKIINEDQISNRAQLFLEGLKHSGRPEVVEFAKSSKFKGMLSSAKAKNYDELKQMLTK
tara:strand:- start:783 stop:992 length:210 start_codon:yes stop_codon:yes gene_type:complete